MNLGLCALVITFFVIFFIVITKKCTVFLFLGSLIASVFLFKSHFLSGLLSALLEEVCSSANLFVMCLLFGSLIALLKKSNAAISFSKYVLLRCKNQKQCYLVSFLLGLFIFVDDYLSIMSLGLCMKKTFDCRKIPGEALSYISNCTGTPVCTLIPFSSWAAFYGTLFIKYDCVSAFFRTPLELYSAIIPYMFYSMLVVCILFLFCMGIFPKIGQMKKAFLRVLPEEENTAMVDDCKKPYFFVLPIIVLVVVCLVTNDIIAGVLSSVVTCFVLYVPSGNMKLKDFIITVVEGFLSLVGVIILLAGCYTFNNLTGKMGMSNYLVVLAQPFFKAEYLPICCFALSAVLSFSTGVVWGTSTLIVPMVMPFIASCPSVLLPSLASLVCGGIFGAQACIYADTTLLSAKGAGITSSAHEFSQLPYICIPAVVCAIIYLILGLSAV